MSNGSHMVYIHDFRTITNQLVNIDRLLKDHSTSASLDDFSWPYVGDLGKISELLSEVEKFLTNQD